MRNFHVGTRSRLGVSFSERLVHIPRRRIDDAWPLHPVWALRSSDGSQSRAKTREIVNPDRSHAKNRIICDIEHRDKTTDGVDGKKTKAQVAQSMQSSGSVLIPNPTDGYLRGGQLEQGEIDRDRWNDGAGRDLEKLIYVDRLGRKSNGRAFMCDVRATALVGITRDTRDDLK